MIALIIFTTGVQRITARRIPSCALCSSARLETIAGALLVMSATVHTLAPLWALDVKGTDRALTVHFSELGFRLFARFGPNPLGVRCLQA